MSSSEEDYGRPSRSHHHIRNATIHGKYLLPAELDSHRTTKYLLASDVETSSLKHVGGKYLLPEASTSSDGKYLLSGDLDGIGVPTSPSARPERFDRYSTLPSRRHYAHGGSGYSAPDRYLPPPAPAPCERYIPSERYIPPPAPSNDRYISSSDRYISERMYHTGSSSAGGDPYMRRDLGYHHHYRLPPPPQYHIHHQSNYYQPHYQRRLVYHASPHPASAASLSALAAGPHHLRCCPSPSHYVPDDAANVNSASTLAPVLAASLTAGQNLKSFSASVNVNIVPNDRVAAREYMGASGGRHVSTPTPPLAPDDTSASEGNHYPPARRSCSGVLEPCCPSTQPPAHRRTVENGSSTLTRGRVDVGCCSNGRRSESSTAASASVSGVMSPCPTHPSSVWRGMNMSQTSTESCRSQSGSQSGSQSSNSQMSGSRNSCQTPGTDTTPVSSTSVGSSASSTSSSVTNQGASYNINASIPVGLTVDAATDAEVSVTVTSTTSPSSAASPTPIAPVTAPSLASQPTLTQTAEQSTLTGPVQRPRMPATPDRLPPTFRERVLGLWSEEMFNFLGLRRNCEKREREMWLERHKRLALRRFGNLSDDVPPPRLHTQPNPSAYPPVKDRYHRRLSALHGRETFLRRSKQYTEDEDFPPGWYDWTGSKKPSVAQLIYSCITYILSIFLRRRARVFERNRHWSRSYAPSDIPLNGACIPNGEVFFDSLEPSTNSSDTRVPDSSLVRRSALWQRGGRRDSSPGSTHHSAADIGNSRIDSSFLGRAFDNSNRRQHGMGLLPRLFRRKLVKQNIRDPHWKELMDDHDDYRPYFTYWLTTVQIIVFVLAVFVYGFAPPGFDLAKKSGLVLVTSLSLQQVEYLEPANFYLGPRAADLIHLGCRYAPCMRNDPMIKKQREKWRERERDTACCIRNDDSGCVQSSQADCSFLHNNLVRGLEGPTRTISTWKKWTAGDAESGGRISGSVCGLDPKFCENPASVKPHEWPDDITKWPICRKTSAIPRRYRQKDGAGSGSQQGQGGLSKIAVAEHMACEVIGHPCCIGIHGTCSITTREYCDFVNGYFHEEASLCSQVSCMEDICGMLPFYSQDVPDQIYRLWTSMFLHAGILHLALTVWFQMWIMRDLEKMMGTIRMAVIFIGTGISSSVASCMFTPYRAEVGPAGAHLGILGYVLIEILHMWNHLHSPHICALRFLGIIFCFIIFGFLPWIDNFAHLFGIIFGVIYSFIVMPFVIMGKYHRDRKLLFVVGCSLFTIAFTLLLLAYFYFHPVEECLLMFCSVFSCLPLTKNFCAEQNIHFIKTGDV